MTKTQAHSLVQALKKEFHGQVEAEHINGHGRYRFAVTSKPLPECRNCAGRMRFGKLWIARCPPMRPSTFRLFWLLPPPT